MKKLVIISLILFISSSVVYSAPNYNPNYPTVFYDDSYNVELFNRLKKEYNEKCWKGDHNICGTNSYGNMVYQKYFDLKKPTEELPQRIMK